MINGNKVLRFEEGLSEYEALKELPFSEFPVVTDFEVKFTKTEAFGMHVVYCSKARGKISGFPWWDHVEREVRSPSLIPMGTIDSPYDELEQGWQKYIFEHEGFVNILQGKEPCCREFEIWYRVTKEDYLARWSELIALNAT